MKEREKSLKLAKLMGWRVDKDGCRSKNWWTLHMMH